VVNHWIQLALVERSIKHGLAVASPLQSQLFAKQFAALDAFMQARGSFPLSHIALFILLYGAFV
jgi:hypothetical protein